MPKKYAQTTTALFFTLILFAGLLACTPSPAELSPGPDKTTLPGLSLTEEAAEDETIHASATPTETIVPTPTIPSSTPTNTITPSPTLTQTPTITPTATPERTPEPFVIPPGELGYNYFYFPEDPFFEDKGFQSIMFVSADLESISVEDEYLVVRIRTLVRNQEVVLQSKVRGFKYNDDEANEKYFITSANIDDFTSKIIGQRITPSFFYSQRQRTASEKEIMFNTCNYTGDSKGGISAKMYYTPICANWGLYASLETEGVLTKDAYANFILSQEDLNNVDINLISPFYSFSLYP
ncbi:MAG TPA: hypothetical protein PLU23_00180 [Anaerolineaceae bacterium]|nr:hypothetical protein [Anaerolineaceae bacterium]